jgi:hypothetical protein
MADTAQTSTDDRRFTMIAVAGSVVALALVAGLVAVGVMVIGNPEAHATVEVIRDMFVILVAFEVMVIGVAIVVMAVQIARLVNLLQNEIRPILTSTNETVSTVRGTAIFLSQNVTEPVVRAGGTMAGIRSLFQEIGALGDLARPESKTDNRKGSASPQDAGKSNPTGKQPDKQSRKAAQKEGE